MRQIKQNCKPQLSIMCVVELVIQFSNDKGGRIKQEFTRMMNVYSLLSSIAYT